MHIKWVACTVLINRATDELISSSDIWKAFATLLISCDQTDFKQGIHSCSVDELHVGKGVPQQGQCPMSCWKIQLHMSKPGSHKRVHTQASSQDVSFRLLQDTRSWKMHPCNDKNSRGRIWQLIPVDHKTENWVAVLLMGNKCLQQGCFLSVFAYP